MTLEPMLTEQEASEVLKVPMATLRFWRRQGRLTFYKLGRHVRFRQVDLEAFIVSRRHEAVSSTRFARRIR